MICMNNTSRLKLRLKTLTLISIVLMTSVFGIFLTNISNSTSELTNEGEEDRSNNLLNLKYSASSNATWWDKSYSYRQIINVTNPYTVILTNYAVNITFDYSNLVDDGKLNSDLSDLRIVENGVLRKYYFEKDFPNINQTTVWFDTNISAETTESDTFLYFGKPAAVIDEEGHYFMNTATNDDSDSFGWIRNGNFEFENKSNAPDPTLINGVVGWNWTDDVPYDVGNTDYSPDPPPFVDYQHNLSVYNNQHEILKGDYTFKWGVTDHEVISTSVGQDFIGTLYSYPFIIPEIAGSGSPKIYINFWRNIRVYDKSRNNFVQYFARISEDYIQTMDSGHNILGQYAERWESTGTNNNNKERLVNVYMDEETTTNTALFANDVNGPLSFDVTAHQGKLVFLEFGMYGLEGSAVSAFGQIDGVRFNYILQTDLDPFVEQRKAEITIITRDVDGRIVPNAEVLLINSTGLYEVLETQYTSSDDGAAIFPSVSFGDYNFTVNYTLPEGKEIVVYNSSAIVGFPGYTIDAAQNTFDLPLNMWTIDFEMVDYNKEPLYLGYVLVNDSAGSGELLANLTLDENGKATFRGENQSDYYYQVFYDNIDYNLNPTALNESYIYRSTYEQNNKYQFQILYIKQLNLNATGANDFTVSQRVYTNGSLTELGNKKFTHANINISLLDQGCDFTSVRIYYIDEFNSTAGNLIYENTTYQSADVQDIIDFDISYPPIASANLPEDSYEVYGLLVELIGDNSSATTCDGVINVNFTETTNIYNVTDLCKLNIRFIDTVGNGISGQYININSTNNRYGDIFYTGSNFGQLKTDAEGYGFGQNNPNVPFWFLRGYVYNFTVIFGSLHSYITVNESDQYKPKDGIYYYNHTVYTKANLTFGIFIPGGGVINMSKYQTRFNDLDVVEQIMWGENVTVNVNFTKTDDEWVDNIEPVDLPAVVNCTVRSTGIGAKTYFIISMAPGVGAGIFTATFNSSRLSAGTRGGEVYSIIVSGVKEGYIDPTDVSDTIYVEAVPTILNMFDYDNTSIEIDDLSQIFGESINLTVKYYNDTNSPFTDAILTYEWLSLDPIQFYEDPDNAGFYTTSLNTSLAEVWGLRSITVKALRENYTSQILLTSLSIAERPTSLNGEVDLVYLSTKVWVQDPNPFEFVYEDTMSSENIGNLTSTTYIWEQLYPNGTRIPGIHGSGSLIQNINTTHILDFKTELKEIGNYYLYITLHKQNYKPKSALINLEILSREFSYALEPGKITDSIMTIENGDSIDLSMTLHDLTRDKPLQGATISMSYQNINYNFTEAGSGNYSVNITDYPLLGEDATSDTSTTGIIISKANFTTQIIDVTIVLNNRRFDSTFSEEFKDNLVQIISGNRLTFDVTLENAYDQSLITDATITLTIDDQPYEGLILINNGDGTYSFTFLSYPEAFTSGKTLSGTVTIQRTNYKTESIPITIEIKMEEIFPGVPTFYFILITGAVIGVVGSIVAYRVIQQARIPKHVKKIRKVKGLIKSKKKIADIASVPSKNEMLAKIFGAEWKTIGLEIGDVLGLKDIKAKKIPLKDKEPKEKIKKVKVPKEKIKKEKLSKDKMQKKKPEVKKVPEEKSAVEKTPKTEETEKGEDE